MGHHLFTIGESVLAMKDVDVVLVRHFLIEAARQLALTEVRASIEEWECHGPGIWVGIEERVLQTHSEIFDKAAGILASFGSDLPKAYLQARLPQQYGITWGSSLQTGLVSEELSRLASFVG